MKNVGGVYIGGIDSLNEVNLNFAIVHATKTTFNSDQDINGNGLYIKDNELFINLVDSSNINNFNIEQFREIIDFIDKNKKSGREVLVHCDFGVSRSASLVFLYLAKKTDFLPDNFNLALKMFENEYPRYNPAGILEFIKSNWSDF